MSPYSATHRGFQSQWSPGHFWAAHRMVWNLLTWNLSRYHVSTKEKLEDIDVQQQMASQILNPLTLI